MKNSEWLYKLFSVSHLYRFGKFVLDPNRRTLHRLDSPVSLTPKAFDLLLFLIQNPNRLVTKEELLQAVWADTFVEEGNLTQYISHLRKALSDESNNGGWIVTISRKGYQFTATVVTDEARDTGAGGEAQVSTADGSLPHAQPAFDSPANEAAARKKSKKTRRVMLISVSAVVLAVACSAYWWRFHTDVRTRSEKVMLAVLPFENLTGDPNKEYLADGLTDETISVLGRLDPAELGVIARTSVMGYKHKGERLDQIGRDLSVLYVLENSLRENGNRIRLTAQLIQVKDQTHLWSQDYDYPANDFLAVEDDVAKAVAREIRLRLTSKQQADLAQSQPVKPEAFDAYLQGHYYFERDSDKDTEMAAKYFERATQLDPSYALAWAELSRARKWQANTGLIPSEEGHRLAREALDRALALNPNLGEAHAQMARVKQQIDFDWTGADASIRRAVELEPGNPEFAGVAAQSAAILGRLDEALQLLHRAVSLDPLNARSWAGIGEIEFRAGKLTEAEADLKKARELRPDDFLCSFFLSQIYVMQGRPQDALPVVERVGYPAVRTFLYAITYQALGRKKESDAALQELITKYQVPDPYLIAETYAFRNQSDEAFKWLDRAYADRNDGLIFVKVEPTLTSLHNDPRFGALLKKLNLPN